MVESFALDSVLISWIAISVGLFVGELMLPQFFLFWFGVGGLAAMVSHILGIPYELQWGVFAVVSVVGLLFTRPFARMISKEEPKKSVVGALIGERMKVTKRIDNIKGTGQVFGKGDSWRAVSEDDTPIDVEIIVEVKRVEGVSLIVTPAEKESE